jgi:hypothetical protein
MALKWDPKDPNEVLDYEIDWSARLKSGDTISAASWITPAGITVDSNSFTDTTVTVWLSGGTLNDVYTITSRVVTSGGRTMDQSVQLKIKDK